MGSENKRRVVHEPGAKLELSRLFRGGVKIVSGFWALTY